MNKAPLIWARPYRWNEVKSIPFLRMDGTPPAYSSIFDMMMRLSHNEAFIAAKFLAFREPSEIAEFQICPKNTQTWSFVLPKFLKVAKARSYLLDPNRSYILHLHRYKGSLFNVESLVSVVYDINNQEFINLMD